MGSVFMELNVTPLKTPLNELHELGGGGADFSGIIKQKHIFHPGKK